MIGVDDYRRALGAQFREVRKAQGKSLEELGDTTWISEEMLRKIEAGDKDTPLQTLHQYAFILGMHLTLVEI